MSDPIYNPCWSACYVKQLISLGTIIENVIWNMRNSCNLLLLYMNILSWSFKCFFGLHYIWNLFTLALLLHDSVLRMQWLFTCILPRLFQVNNQLLDWSAYCKNLAFVPPLNSLSLDTASITLLVYVENHFLCYYIWIIWLN